jgi:hypothetical protein
MIGRDVMFEVPFKQSEESIGISVGKYFERSAACLFKVSPSQSHKRWICVDFSLCDIGTSLQPDQLLISR